MEKNFEIDLKSVGGRIRNVRMQMGLTQEKAAERTEFTGQYWSLLETGRERGSVSTYLQIAKALEITLDDIFYDEAPAIRLRKTLSEDGLLVGCTISENKIISEILLALKDILERNRRC